MIFYLLECSLVVTALGTLTDKKPNLVLFLFFTNSSIIKQEILSGCNGKILGKLK